MSKRSPSSRVLEWSARGLRASVGGGPPQEFGSFEEAARALGSGPILLALSRRSVFLRVIPLPTAPLADLRRLVEFRIGELFPLGEGEAAFDVLPTEKIDAEGRLTLVVAVSSSELARIFAEAEAAGFTILQVLPTALASPHVVRRAGLAEAILVEATPEGLAFDAVVDGDLRASRVAMPGVPFEEEIRRTAALVGLEDPPVLAFGEIPGMEVAPAPASPLSALVSPGAPRWALDIEPREVILARENRTRRRRVRFAALLATSALALLTLIAVDRSEAQARVDRERAKMNASLNRLRGLQRAAEADLLQAAAVRQALDLAFDPAQPLSDVVAAIADATTEDLWLSGLSVERGKPITIRGTATTSEAVARYLERLSASPRLRDVRLVVSNNATIGETAVIQFSVTAFPVGNLPLAEAGSKRRP